MTSLYRARVCRVVPLEKRNAIWMSRCHSRGIPYTPVGTIQDFTSSPRHIGIEKLFREKDEALNRNSSQHNYSGPIVTTPEGSQPMFPSHASLKELYAETAAEAGDSYRQDCRTDPQYAHLPPHVRSAQQSVLDMQHDSFGETIRGMVPPPPALDPAAAPQAYTPPRANIPRCWYAVVGGFLAVFSLMGAYGS